LRSVSCKVSVLYLCSVRTAMCRHRIVLVEGNYLLLFSDPAWAPLRDVFDEKWFISVPLDAAMERVLKRHMKHGI